MQGAASGNGPIRLLALGLAWPPETFLQNVLAGMDPARVHVSVACVRRTGDPRPPGWRRQMGSDSPPWEALVAGPEALWRVQRAPARQRTRAFEVVRGPAPLRARLSQFTREASLLGSWDVVYFPWSAGPGGFPNVLTLGAAMVVSCRGAQVNVAPLDPDRADLVDDLRFAFEHATLVHCVSDDIVAEAAQYGLDPGRTRVIRPAVDTARFAPTADRPKPLRQVGERFDLLTTGTLYWRKGSEDLLVALRQLVDAGVDAHLRLIGTGDEEQRVRFTTHDLGLDDRVHLLGRRTPDEVSAALRAADAFVLASLSEGISNTVLEGMASGLPVVTTTAGGMAEAVTDGVEGYLVPPGDPAAMAAALGRLAADPVQARRMGAAGRVRATEGFDVRDQVEAYTRLFEEAAALGPRAVPLGALAR